MSGFIRALCAGAVFFFVCSLNGQDINSIELQNLQVDALSDEQVQAFIQRAQSSGLSQTQMEALARQRGMSEVEISKLRSRILQLNPSSAGDVQEALESKSSRLREDPLGPLLLDVNDLTLLEVLKKGENEFKVFGLDMFGGDNQASFQETLNMPTPKNYILGAGDELIIDIYGASEITYKEEISPDGQIIIQGIGPIRVAGISVEVARPKIFKKLTNIYSGLSGRTPNTFAQVSVGNIRTIKVNVIGQVQRPGTYSLNSFSSVFNALYLSGGPTEKGSLRRIRLIRDGEEANVFDVYDYLFDSSDDSNIILQDGDQIVIDPFINRVSLSGAVKNPAKYELLEGETFEDLISFAGGFEGDAYQETITIERNNGRMKSIATINNMAFDESILFNGDSINVGVIVDRFENRVNISGAIMRPGNYELTQGLMLSDLIEKADGLREDAFKGRGNIFRQKEDLTLKNIAFNLNEIINGSQDLLLQREDRVVLPSIFDLRTELIVKIDGEIGNPGTYPYLDQMTVEDLINISGGFKESANKSIVEVARQVSYNQKEIGRSAEIFTFEIDENLILSESASTFELMPFDVVLIKRSSFFQEQKLVKIEGEVLYPGFYALETREDKISDLVERAGGLTEFAYSNGATILRRTEFYQPILTDSTDVLYELEADKYRSGRLKELQRRDVQSEINQLGELESIGINLVESLKTPGSKFDLILEEGDVLSVPKELQTVRVRGNVLYPNTIRYEPGMNFKRTISKAGGFADDAKIGKSYVIYANGNAERTKNFLFFRNYPNIEPGAEIIVPRRTREKTPLNVQQVLALTSSLATLLLVITQLNP
ncbi:MAG: SLBB domain-containing protein [Cyclobacteriaceae bacterium]